ncbi:DUF3667 domain-containing protein [Marinoscillum sp.]|uniref:DUF3667 domain-containing protein n=1 Tax=Marinoscillum sp. TaxID=2024838 RepID=UPI003BAA167A
MADQPNQCINCEVEATGNFCWNCGQKLHLQKITWKYALSDFADRWLGMDTKYGRTIVDLFRRPEQVIETYLQGNSIRYIGPLGYYLVMTALMLLLFEFLGITVNEFMEESSKSMGFVPEKPSEKQVAFQAQYMQWVADHFRMFAGVLIPFLALTGKIYYRKRHTYLHHLIRFTYIQANGVWFTMAMVTIYYFTGQLFTGWGMAISTTYIGWAIMRTYPQKNNVWGFLKGLLVWISSYLIFMIVMAIVGVIIGLVLVKMGYFN